MLWLVACTDATTPVETSLGFDRALIVPAADGLWFFDGTGDLVWADTWDALVGGCPTCGGEGANPDGDALLVAFTTGGSNSPGAIARLNGDLTLDWRVDGFAFPHGAVRTPDGQIAVAETFEDAITWVAGDGTSAAPLRQIGIPEGVDPLPNGIKRIDHGGRTYLLLSHRGIGGNGQSIGLATGNVSLWDVTAAPTEVWRFPEQGTLDTPHGPIFRERDGRWWLVYAHTQGADQGGSVGLAVTDDPAVRPAYVADLLPPADVAPFVFLRGVELDDAGLWLTDSGLAGGGGIGGATGRLLRADFPALEPTGATGEVESGQVFAELTGVQVLADALANPFEAWWWTR